MKKTLLFLSLAAIASVSLHAQTEEDVTRFIQNPGFDQDITWNVDGTTKTIVGQENLSTRSQAWYAADNTVYAHATGTGGKTRPDGLTTSAWNGFIGHIQGWEIVSNKNVVPPYTTGNSFPEWVYFGSVPYGISATAIPISDDSNGFLAPAAKPAEDSGDDNKAALYLRGGWGASAAYKQTVSLPCAQYRLDYWVYNANYANSSSNTGVQNLCQISYRNEVVKDEDGFNAQNWTLHSIEFTPISDFTIQFGFVASGGSNSNPFIFIDGIRLYKIGEADPADILLSDLDVLNDSIMTIMESASELGADGLVAQMEGGMEISDNLSQNNTPEEIQAGINQIRDLIAQGKAALAAAAKVQTLLAKAEALAAATSYAGIDAFQAAIADASSTIAEGNSDAIVALEQTLKDAITAYNFSQEASVDAPADYTFLVTNPWFVVEGREPASNSNADIAAMGYQDADKDGRGWAVNGANTAGVQQVFFNVGRTCWQGWSTNAGVRSVGQTLTGMPNGLYKVTADALTNDLALNDQHVYGRTSLNEAVGYMTAAGVVTGWASGAYTGDYPNGTTNPWETITTEDYAVVIDGNLTIGFAGDKAANDASTGGRSGSFWVTNFKLSYYGPASEELISSMIATKVNDAQAAVDAIQFAADKAAASDTLALAKQTNDLAKIGVAKTLADASNNKYAEIMGEGKTIPTVSAALAGTETYGAATEIVRHAFDNTQAWIASAQATYAKVDSILNVLKGYSATFAPAYKSASETLAAYGSETSKTILTEALAKAEAAVNVTPLLSTTAMDAVVAELNRVLSIANAQNTYDTNPDATDYTSAIQNPDIAAETGWTINKGVGNTNSASGQHYSGNTSRRYLDSWNGTAGTLNYYAEQVVTDIPNGTYTLTAAVRTSGEGSFVFAGNTGAAPSDTIWKEIIIEKHYDIESGTEVDATAQYGSIWEAADAKAEAGTATAEEEAIATANSNKGWGWHYLTIENIVVNDHKMVIGVTTDGARSGKAFTGTWFSVTDFKLTLTAKGDNSDWGGPATGIDTIENETKADKAIYDLQGRRVNNLSRGQMYIINGKKVYVK